MKYIRQPYDYQLKVLEESYKHNDYAFFCEVGTGKSLLAVNFARNKFLSYGRRLRTIIFCPNVVLYNWIEEWVQNSELDRSNFLVLDQPGKKRAELIRQNPGKIFITNYESLNIEPFKQALTAWEPELIIWDESQKLKDITTDRVKHAKKIAELAKHRIILSGTPILNSTMDIFSQYYCMDLGETFGKNFYTFRSTYFTDKNARMPSHAHFPNWIPKPTMQKELQEKIAAKSAVVTQEVLNLPELEKIVCKVRLDNKQKYNYEKMRKDLVIYLNDKACVANLALTKALRLLQIVSGFYKMDDDTIIRMHPNPRLTALKELLDLHTPVKKVLIWAVFKQNYQDISELCDRMGLKYVIITGDTKPKVRQQYIDQFTNDPETKVFIGHPTSAGIGCNLTSSPMAIFYSRTFSLEQYEQANGRHNRNGAQKWDKLFTIDLVAEDTIDEQVLEALKEKRNIGDTALRKFLGV